MPHFRIAQKCQEISQINKASLCHLGKSKSHSLVAFHVAICTLSWGKKNGASNCKQLQKKKKWQTIPTQTQYLKTWDTLSQVKMY